MRMYEGIEYSRCACGAITVYMPNGATYSCKAWRKPLLMANVDLRSAKRLPDTYCCDHCVNHYGLDLCGCGCGETVGHCINPGLHGSNLPMQVFEGRQRITGAMALTARGLV